MPKRLRHLKSLGMNPRVIYDVGAAQGKWAQLAALIWHDAQIIGFEPNRANIERLEQIQRELPNFEYIRCFLGTKQQVVHYEYRGNQTSLYDSVAQKEPTDTADMLVLDDLIAQGRIPMPDFIKMDVQGYELEVLRGGIEAFKTCEMVLLEVSFYREHPQMPTIEEVIAFMVAHGFRWFDVMGMIRYPDDDALWQMDLHFLKTSHAIWRRHE
jgi:FkbM family methyltransferase